MQLVNEKRVIDFTQVYAVTSSGLSQTIINVIEQNTQTQVNKKVLFTEFTKVAGLIQQVRKYQDSTKTVQLYEVDVTWVSGLPQTIVVNNMDDGIITTTTIGWGSDGTPDSINKVEA
jgi:hypothetical protein